MIEVFMTLSFNIFIQYLIWGSCEYGNDIYNFTPKSNSQELRRVS